MTVAITDPSPLRQPMLHLTIGAFSIAAFMGVVALLSGSFGDTQVRILLTTLVIGITSVCMLCCLATSGTSYASVGLFGQLSLVLPVVTGLTLVWHEFGGTEEVWLKAFGIGCVIAATLAQVSLLLALAGERSDLAVALRATVVVAALLAALLCLMILGEADDDDLWRLVGVLAILDVLGTLVTTAMAKFGRRDGAVPFEPRLPAEASRLPAELEMRLVARARDAGLPPATLLAEAVRSYLDRETAY